MTEQTGVVVRAGRWVALAALLVAIGACDGGISLGVSAGDAVGDDVFSGADTDSTQDGAAPGEPRDSTSSDGANDSGQVDVTQDASSTSIDVDAQQEGPTPDSSDASSMDSADSPQTPADSGDEADAGSADADASVAVDGSDGGASDADSSLAVETGDDSTPGADAHSTDDASDTGLDVVVPCGDASETCCEAGTCNGTSLACNLGSCVQAGAGTPGMPCSNASACTDDLCLPISGTRSACTVSCATSADCIAGWTCSTIGGQTAKACQCTASPEICDGKDNDCDGIVDDVLPTDLACASSIGAGYVCSGGSCTCGQVCGVACADTRNDPSNCGGCGNACATGVNCLLSSCGGKTAVALGVGSASACAVLSTGGVACWGNNSYGQLGSGAPESFSSVGSAIPVAVVNLAGSAKTVIGGLRNQCAVLTDGRVECWGSNQYGQLNNGTTSDSSYAVPTFSTATAVTAGLFHVCALLPAGTVECWGDNSSGQLGSGSTSSSSGPVTLPGLTNISAITAGDSHTCALVSDGTVKCWGDNSYGQLALSTTTAQSSTPVTVAGVTNAIAISAGTDHTCAVIKGGTVRCWGDNSQGQLGNGSAMSSGTPVPTLPVDVSNLTDATAVSGGYSTTCALRSSGSVQCWGADSTVSSSVPVTVSGLSGVTAIGSGEGVHCALKSDGTVSCWGDNSAGELGNGTTNSSTTPVGVHL
jgi:alpha-tubulin suppressor-like RCC1 family protein